MICPIPHHVNPFPEESRHRLAVELAGRLSRVAANGHKRRAAKLLREARAVLPEPTSAAVERHALGADHRILAQRLLAADPAEVG